MWLSKLKNKSNLKQLKKNSDFVLNTSNRNTISELKLNRFKMQQSQSQFNDKIEET